jgi:hypothetical protein
MQNESNASLCTYEDWCPYYDKSPMCLYCKLLLSKERSDMAASFWESYSSVRGGRMYNTSIHEAARHFKGG